MAMDPQGDYATLAVTSTASPPVPSTSSAATSFPILVISILGILTTSVLLLGYYVFIIKCFLNRQRLDDVIGRLTSRSHRRWNVQLNAELADGASTERPRGLDESTIRAIPTFRYRGKGSEVPQRPPAFHECAVCLSEFQEGERIRLLPNCRHVFHIDCIDAWLQTSANCPLCRLAVTVTGPIPPADHDLLPVILPQQALHQLSGEVVMRVRDVDGASNQIPVPVADARAINPPPRKAEQRLEREKGRKLRHVGSMGDECINVRVEDEQFHRVQPMRRSFSMDSSADRGLYMAVQKVLQQNPHFHEVVVAEESSSSSNSGRTRWSLLSFGRSSRNAVLPVQSQL